MFVRLLTASLYFFKSSSSWIVSVTEKWEQIIGPNTSGPCHIRYTLSNSFISVKFILFLRRSSSSRTTGTPNISIINATRGKHGKGASECRADFHVEMHPEEFDVLSWGAIVDYPTQTNNNSMEVKHEQMERIRRVMQFSPDDSQFEKKTASFSAKFT